MPTVRPFLSHTADLPVESFDWGELRWLCNDKLSPGAAQTLGICTIWPKRGNPPHYHPNCEELLYVLKGHGQHSFDDVVVDLEAGMTIRVPSGVRHNLKNTGDGPLECVVTFSSGQRQTVFLE